MRKLLALLTASLAIADSAYAHGPQIQVTNDGGKIVTRQIFLDGPYAALTGQKSVYVMPFLDNLGVTYARPNNVDFVAPGVPEFYSGAGLAMGYGFDAVNNPAPFVIGSKFFVNFTAGLKKWDGAAFVDPGIAQIQAFTGSFSAPTGTATTTDAGPFASLAVQPGAATVEFSDGVEEHATVRYRFLGDGVTPSSAANGIYLLSLQFSNPTAGLQPSDPLNFVLNKQADSVALQAAVASLGVSPNLIQSLVPEPTSAAWALGGLFSALAAGRRWRRS